MDQGSAKSGSKRLLFPLGRSLWGIPLLVAVTLLPGGCDKSDDEKQIRALVEQAARAAEKHDISGLLKLTTKKFIAMPGERNRRDVKGLLFVAFRRYGEMAVEMPRPTVNLDKSGQFAEVDTPFVIRRKGSTLPDLKDLYHDPEGWTAQLDKMADLYDLHLWLIKEGDTWLVRQVRLQGMNRLEDL